MKIKASLVVLASVLALCTAATLRADGPCSNQTAAGNWGYTSTGNILAGPLAGPIAGVGSYAADRDGNIFDGKQTVSFNGTIVDETFSGTYTLNEDCTGKATVVVASPIAPRTTTLEFVLVDQSSEERAIFRSPFTVITLNSKKLRNN